MVRATFAGFGTALSALQASQKRLDITGQNLANMNTPGYTRQQLQVSSLNYTNPTSHYLNDTSVPVGFGVRMDAVTQIRDPYLDVQYRDQMTKSGYTDACQAALDSLAGVFDETKISGIDQAFKNIRSTLLNMQDPSKINDPVLESELRSRMEALTNLLGDASRQVTQMEENEFTRLEGSGTSENGAVQTVNDMLRQIGDLNRQIKQNQIVGEPALELTDQRNSLLDQLSSYLPIRVTYYKDADHDGKKADGSGGVTAAPEELYHMDADGNILGKKEWPDDLKVEALYTDKDGRSQRITLVDGTNGTGASNYGSVSVTAGSKDDPLATALTFSQATSAGVKSAVFPAVTPAGTTGKNQFSSGSIQASLRMLGEDGTDGGIRGYGFYTGQLDTLAKQFAQVMNAANAANAATGTTDTKLLVNKATGTAVGITAANIGINTEWVKGNVHVSKGGASTTDTVLEMYQQIQAGQTALGDKTFFGFINNTSTILANDSSSNQTALKTNVTVLNGIQDSRDSVSGVSLDEEASNMMTYISAYNAASRLMTTLDQALDALINSTGVVGR